MSRLLHSLPAAGIPVSPELSAAWSALSERRLAAVRQLQAAATYPLSLSLGIALAGAMVVGFAAPSLALLPSGAASEREDLLLIGLGLALALLSGLGLVVLTRLPLPGVGLGWQSIDAWTLLEGTRLLCEAGAELPQALRVAGDACDRAGQAQALALSRALEAGGTEARASSSAPAGPLQPIEVQTLLNAARTGTVAPLLQALAVHRRVGLERLLPAAVDRVQYTALVVAGLAVLAIGATLFEVYSDALR